MLGLKENWEVKHAKKDGTNVFLHEKESIVGSIQLTVD